MRHHWVDLGRAAVILAFVVLAPGSPWLEAQNVEVIYTEIPGDPTAVVPGAVDSNGDPVLTEFATLFALSVSPGGTSWILKATTTQSDAERNVMLMGGGATGAVFAQEGQPVAAGGAGEVYDFFDDVAGLDDTGRFAFGARAREGDPDVAEKVIVFDGADYEIRVAEGDPCVGLDDLPPDPAGDETFGNSLNSIHLLDDGSVVFVAVTITNVHSSRRPALFYDDLAFAQSGVTAIGAEVWDSFDSNDFRTSPDGSHWVAQGDTENPDTAVDDILAYDGEVVLREGDEIGTSGIIIAAVFASAVSPAGDWIARGDNPADDDWIVLNGSLLTATGEPIATGASDTWGPIISIAAVNSSAQTLVAGETSAGDAVLVSGDTELLREGDPIDLDGNGSFDDDVFLNGFKPHGHLAADGTVHVLATLRNGIGDALGDAFLRIGGGDPNAFIRGDADGNATFNGLVDGLFVLSFQFIPGSPAPPCDDAADADDDGVLNGLVDGLYILSSAFTPGAPPPPFPWPGCGTDDTSDSLGCVDHDCP